jgi:hypothetical protein
MISTLCKTIKRMETEMQEQGALLKTLLERTANASPSPVTSTTPQGEQAKEAPATHNAEGQWMKTTHKTYADSVKSTKVQNKYGQNTNDVKTNDVRSKVPENNDQHVPRVLLLHDSTLRGINPDRMGYSYDLRVVSQTVSTIDAIAEAAEQASIDLHPAPDSVVIHVGINDIKSKGSESDECGRLFAQAVEDVSNIFPHSKVVCSHSLPTKDEKLDAKRVLFNAHVYSEVSKTQMKNISYASHENLSLAKHFKDDIHPNAYGTAILARNLGRLIRGMFWEKPKRKRNTQSETKGYSRTWRREKPMQGRDYKRDAGPRPMLSGRPTGQRFLPHPHLRDPELGYRPASGGPSLKFRRIHRRAAPRPLPDPGPALLHRDSAPQAFPFYSPPWLY